MAEAQLDVAACLQRVRKGDEDAAKDLMEHLYPLVIKLVRAHLPRRTSEEDLVQTVYMKVFSKLDQFSGEVPLEHWVSRIAVNTCFKQLDRERVRPELRWADLSEEQEEVLTKVASDESSVGPADYLATRELVEKVMAQLSPQDRLVITLLHLEGRTLEEVKAVTGWNTTLIKVRAFRARQRMKKFLEALTVHKTL